MDENTTDRELVGKLILALIGVFLFAMGFAIGNSDAKYYKDKLRKDIESFEVTINEKSYHFVPGTPPKY